MALNVFPDAVIVITYVGLHALVGGKFERFEREYIFAVSIDSTVFTPAGFPGVHSHELGVRFITLLCDTTMRHGYFQVVHGIVARAYILTKLLHEGRGRGLGCRRRRLNCLRRRLGRLPRRRIRCRNRPGAALRPPAAAAAAAAATSSYFGAPGTSSFSIPKAALPSLLKPSQLQPPSLLSVKQAASALSEAGAYTRPLFGST